MFFIFRLQSLLFEIGEAYREIVEIKASSGWPHRKVAKAGAVAVESARLNNAPPCRLFRNLPLQIADALGSEWVRSHSFPRLCPVSAVLRVP